MVSQMMLKEQYNILVEKIINKEIEESIQYLKMAIQFPQTDFWLRLLTISCGFYGKISNKRPNKVLSYRHIIYLWLVSNFKNGEF